MIEDLHQSTTRVRAQVNKDKHGWTQVKPEQKRVNTSDYEYAELVWGKIFFTKIEEQNYVC